MKHMMGLDFVPDCLDLDAYEVTFPDGSLFIEQFSPASENNDEEEGTDEWFEVQFESWGEPHPVVCVTLTSDGKYLVRGGVAVKSGGEGWEPTGPRQMYDNPKDAARWVKNFL